MKIVDLSVLLYDGLVSFPSHPKMVVMDYETKAKSKARYIPPCEGFNSKIFMMSDHGGTHLDAPYHFFDDGLTIEEIPLEAVMGEAVLIDVSDKDPDQPVTREMVEAKVKEKQLVIKEGDIVFFRCWPKEWQAEGFFDCKALDGSVGDWVIENKVKAIGLDLPNADINENMRRDVHLKLLGRNILIMENVVHLDQLTKDRFYFIGTPLNLKGMTGSPIRAIAIEEW
ncbi:cyclase family protein [Tuberibacillus calidus]|jgi:kynurenine formamidase|uniref:cyclase family protein n=1 Tax=Tuberibacillus calidus TaxID=340097 RepID=UPI00041352F5|nr:cyclase family protein [Tuberibacillus calidus]